MNTLLLVPEIFSSEGGIPSILRLYLRALCELSEPSGSVSLCTLNDLSFDSRDLRRYSNRLLVDWAACGRHKGRFLKAAWQMSRHANLVVCGHVAQLPVAWLIRKLRGKRVRTALVAHGIEVWRPFTLPERLALRATDRILCVSDYTRREMLRHLPLPMDKLAVLHNALDPHFETGPLSPAPADLDILTVSRLNHSDSYKGVDHLIEAMPAIRRAIPAARLRVVGRGDDLARLQALARSLALEGAVTFLGYVNDTDLRRELRSCRLFALPSQKEGFGLVYLEAMAHGRPCIGARDGGIPEVITPETGLLVDHGNVPALAAACTDALRRTWDMQAILARAGEFSYSRFRDRLASLIPVTA